ncbi:DUF4224 domain-containing protein [Collimonas humicola]|uniref:DUF4224 domain-containing protein n=1 Tax=Collimonas humicola TaxID=2825886 RepID=UPI001B8CEED9|nr:DUF4224 domain-containing protein [Collimonas humicola]
MIKIFLDSSEIFALTGRKMKGRQIDALRKMGIPFYVNATGHPVVTLTAVEGRKEEPTHATWEMPE